MPKKFERTNHEENAIALANALMLGALHEAGMRRTDLARALGVSRPFVTKLLQGDHNLTVRAMARILAACGFELRFSRVKADPTERA